MTEAERELLLLVAQNLADVLTQAGCDVSAGEIEDAIANVENQRDIPADNGVA